jgi:tetratricopeptide (TPR) repeat protein/DNA-binding CsgD family transcriptional regulator
MRTSSSAISARIRSIEGLIESQQFVMALEPAVDLCKDVNYDTTSRLRDVAKTGALLPFLLPSTLLLGRIYARRGFLSKAVIVLEDAVHLGTAASVDRNMQRKSTADENHKKRRSYTADALRYLGQVYAECTRYQESENCMTRALALNVELNRDLEAAQCKSDLVWKYLSVADHAGARPWIQSSLEDFERLGQPLEQAKMLIHLGTIDSVLGDLPAAISTFERARTLASSANGKREHILTLRSIGSALTRMAKFDEGLATLTEALHMAEEHGCEILIAQVLSQVAYNHLRASRFHDAVSYFEREQTLHVMLDREYDLSRSLMNLATTLTSLSEYERAIDLLHKALDIQRRLNLKSSIPGLFLELGTLYYYLRDLERSLDYYVKAMDHARPLGNKRMIATCEGNAGIALLDLQRHEEALAHMHNAIDQFEGMSIWSEAARHRMNAGVAFLDSGQFLRSREYLEAADVVFVQHGMQTEMANVRLNLGRLYSNSTWSDYDPTKAENNFLECIAINTTLGVKQNRYRAYSLLADLYYQEQRWTEFADSYQQYHHLEREALNERALAAAHRFEQQRTIMEMEKQRELDTQRILSQTREVETAVKELVRKNELLSHVLEQSNALTQFVHGEGLDILEQLSQRIERNLVTIDDVRDLRELWDVVHADFLDVLRTKVPSLTDTELKVAVLLKMKLTSTNIATILFVSKRTVEFHRLNIRKKLSLDEKTDLASYFSTLTD